MKPCIEGYIQRVLYDCPGYDTPVAGLALVYNGYRLQRLRECPMVFFFPYSPVFSTPYVAYA